MADVVDARVDAQVSPSNDSEMMDLSREGFAGEGQVPSISPPTMDLEEATSGRGSTMAVAPRPMRAARAACESRSAAVKVGGGCLSWLGDACLASREQKRFRATPRPRHAELPEHRLDACCVCGLACSFVGDDLVYCDGCDKPFHQKCYAVPEIPEGDWFCRPCLSRRKLAVPPSMVPSPPYWDEELEEFPASGDPDGVLDLLKALKLESCPDFGVVASLGDRFGWPSVPMRFLLESLRSDLDDVDGAPCCYVQLVQDLLLKSQWCTKKGLAYWCTSLAECVRGLGAPEASAWLVDADALEEARPMPCQDLLRDDGDVVSAASGLGDDDDGGGGGDAAQGRLFRVGLDVEARWRGRKQYWRATVTKVEGNTVDLVYEDGSAESGVPVGLVRKGVEARTLEVEHMVAMEEAAQAKLAKLPPKKRCRLLRLMAEASLDTDSELKRRIHNASTYGAREPVVGVDAEQRAYKVVEDGDGAVLLVREFDPLHPPIAPTSMVPGKGKPPLPKPRVDPKKRKRAPSFQAVASTALGVAAHANDLLRTSTHGDELWLSKVLRDEVAPYILKLRKQAVADVKKRARAERRQKAILRDLGGFAPLHAHGTRRARAAVNYAED